MDNELLKYGIETGMINEQVLRTNYEMSIKEEILAKHAKHHSIWQNQTTGLWTTTLPDLTKKEKRRIVKRKKLEDLEKVIVDFYKQDVDPTVEDIFYLWIDRRLHQYNDFEKQTANKYVNDYKKYISNTSFSKRRIRGLTEIDVVDFVRVFSADKSITTKMRANFMILIKGIFQYAREKGYSNISMHAIKEDYDIRSHKRAKSHKLPGEDVFLDDEIQLLKDYIYDHSDDIVLLGLLLVIHTGLRVGELAALKWSDFNVEQHILIVSRTEIKYQEDGHTIVDIRESTKGAYGWRIVVISDEVIRILSSIRKLNPDGEFLFMQNGKRVNSNSWTKKLPRLCGKLGIGEIAEGTDRVNGKSVHKLRKTYVSKLIDAHVDPILMTMQAGHVDVGTSYTYYYRNTRSIEQTVNTLLPVLNTL